jgi:hypothetical protein
MGHPIAGGSRSVPFIPASFLYVSVHAHVGPRKGFSRPGRSIPLLTAFKQLMVSSLPFV